jgi:hypothetical protein
MQQVPAGLLLADEQARSLLERLDPPTRAAILMTILGVVLTGIVLCACVMIGAHWVRRMAREKPRASSPGSDSASRRAMRQLRESLAELATDREKSENTGATVLVDKASSETKIDRPARNDHEA